MSTQGARMGLAGWARYSWRRFWLRCESDPKGKSLRKNKPSGKFRCERMFLACVKLASLSAVAFAVGFCFYLAIISRIQDRDLNKFIDTLEKYGRGEAGSHEEGSNLAKKKSHQRRTYDPKARPFVDPKSRSKWRPEADKGRAKRRLFEEVHEMSKEKGRPQYTLPELMELPSSYSPSAGISDTTIILNQWKRTTLSEQLDGILRQTVRPAGGVWVCVFDSPREDAYRTVVENYKERFKNFGGLFFVSSTYNFKYYGRFQMALQARTKYVWIVDDDVRPGRYFLQQLSHIAGIWDAEGAGASNIGPMALGSVGWVMPGVKKVNGKFYGYRFHTEKGGLFLPDKRYSIHVPQLQEVDLLCSHWFIETDWVRLLFREKWETPETGEDYMLAYSLRKFAGVRSYVVPMDLTDSETWGNMDVDWEMQHQGADPTTLGSAVPVRDRLWHRLLKRGGDYFMSARYAPHPRSLLLVVDSAPDAEALRPLFLALQDSYPPTKGFPADTPVAAYATALKTAVPGPQRPPRVVLTARGGHAITCSKAAVLLGNAESADGEKSTLCDADSFASAWQLMGGRHYPRRGKGRAGGSGGRDHVLMVDLALGFAGEVDMLKPLAIISVAGTGNAAGVGKEGGGGAAIDEALAVVSGQSGTPLIRLPRETDASGAALWLSRISSRTFAAWHKARVEILVVYDPAKTGHSEAQLTALLESLWEATYLGDKTDLTVAIGSGPVPDIVASKSPSWHRGHVRVRGSTLSHDPDSDTSPVPSSTSTLLSGSPSPALAALALRSWTPRDDDAFVVVLEADRVVSKLFYSWLKLAVLQTSYDGGKHASIRPRRSVCVPSADAENADGGSHSAWLFPPEHWRDLQTACLRSYIDGDGPGESGDEWCRAKGVPTPTVGSVCPSLDKASEALVAHTKRDGTIMSPEGVVEDIGVFDSLVTRVFFSRSGVEGLD